MFQSNQKLAQGEHLGSAHRANQGFVSISWLVKGTTQNSFKLELFLSTTREVIMDEFLTIQEVADLYGVSTKTVRNWIQEGKLEARRIAGRIIRIEARSLDLLSEPVNYKGYRSRKERTQGSTFLFHSFKFTAVR